MNINERFSRCGIIPVVVLDRPEDALPLANALLEGGIDIAEVTFRTQAAQAAIRLISQEVPDMLVGAGTVISNQQFDQAVKAGGQFIVSPGLDLDLVHKAKAANIPIFPGALTPSEIMQAIKAGLDVVKFFPAGNFGGLSTIKSLSAPFNQLQFMPTGGVNKDNLKDFLALDQIIAVGGSWICSQSLIKEKKWTEITRLCKEAKQILASVRG